MLKESMFQTLYNVVLTNEVVKKIKSFGTNKKGTQSENNSIEQSQFDADLTGLNSFDRNLCSILAKNTLMGLSFYNIPDTDHLHKKINKCSSLISKKLLTLKGVIGIEPITNSTDYVHYMDVVTDNTLNDDNSVAYIFTPVEAEVCAQDIACSLVCPDSYDWPTVTDNLLEEAAVSVFNAITSVIISDIISLAKCNVVCRSHAHLNKQDHSMSAVSLINHSAIDIYNDNRMGLGSVIICHPSSQDTLIRYMSEVGLTYQSSNIDSDKQNFNHVGNILDGCNKKFIVYTSTDIPISPGVDTFVIGYNQPETCKTGYILAPFVNLTSYGVCVNATNFDTTVSLTTRFATHMRVSNAETTVDSTSYYRLIEIESYGK